MKLRYTIFFALMILGTSCSSFNRNPTSEDFSKHQAKQEKKADGQYEQRHWHQDYNSKSPR